MANLKSRSLFFITSPRTPSKMKNEIDLLSSLYEGKEWNYSTQVGFMNELAKKDFFIGSGSAGNSDFSARDRINRGPKALGFIDLEPCIKLTLCGKDYISGKFENEILLRQLLKFQLPSPYHVENEKVEGTFFVKPYLEIIRLIYDLNGLSFDELIIFGMQLTHYKKYEKICKKILKFRATLAKSKTNYKNAIGKIFYKEVYSLYKKEIKAGKTKTRQSADCSVENFVHTKMRNMRDYADACFRYLRATELFNLSQKRKYLSVMPEKKKDVKYILTHIEREPIFIDNVTKYKEYLFNPCLPKLYSDNINNLIKTCNSLGINVTKELGQEKIKEILYIETNKRKQDIINKQVKDLKLYKNYNDVMSVFDSIANNEYYDTPLMLEWNVWRAMTMLDGGNIHANLNFDDNGEPLSTAAGNKPDIICDYGDFNLTVEVTMQTGQRQYEMEGEPVSRHLAQTKKISGKESFCFFIAKSINESCIAHFYMLHKTDISYYGGKSVVIPLDIETFKNMISQSKNSKSIPNPTFVKNFCKYSMEVAKNAQNEKEWFEKITHKAEKWLVA